MERRWHDGWWQIAGGLAGVVLADLVADETHSSSVGWYIAGPFVTLIAWAYFRRDVDEAREVLRRVEAGDLKDHLNNQVGSARIMVDQAQTKAQRNAAIVCLAFWVVGIAFYLMKL